MSTVKNAFAFCELKHAGYIKSIFEVLKEFDIKEKLKLNSLDRFKKTRHDVNYRGFMATIAQAEEILDFWDKCGEEILKNLKKEIEKN